MTREREIEKQRWGILRRLGRWLEPLMIVLGFVWLVLLVYELTWGTARLTESFVLVIWGIFILDFLLRFALAPRKATYLRNNWLTAVALLIPALRVFRIFQALRFLRVVRGLRLVRLLTSINRGMRSLSKSMRRRGFGYVVALTALVTFVGAAGMYTFENRPGERGLNAFSEALWWTAMIMTTMGSDYWPQTPEGRLLCFLLSLYAFAVFGYVTATIATFFIGQEAQVPRGNPAREATLQSLQKELAALRSELKEFAQREKPDADAGPDSPAAS